MGSHSSDGAEMEIMGLLLLACAASMAFARQSSEVQSPLGGLTVISTAALPLV